MMTLMMAAALAAQPAQSNPHSERGHQMPAAADCQHHGAACDCCEDMAAHEPPDPAHAEHRR